MARKKKGGSRRLIFILLGIIVVLMILAVAARGMFLGRESTTTVDVAEAEIRRVTQTVTASGRAQPEVEIVISPDVSGEIIQLPVREGQQVQQGQLLARIKPDFYSAQVEQAEADVLQSRAFLAQRRADLMQASQNLERQNQLFGSSAISENDFEQAQTQHQIAEASLEAAQFSVESAEARLRD